MGLIENRDAQFMLLAGFIIGIGLVITTVMLNSVIFEGNMAIGAGTEPSKNDIINLIQITNDETRAAYRNVTNGSASNDSRIIANFTRQTQNFSYNLSTIYALHGESMNLSWNVSNWNNSNYAYFTDNGTVGGSANWTVIQNVKDSNIIVNVTTFGGSFNITLINSTTSWINLTSGNFTFKNTSVQPYSIVFINGTNNAGRFKITGNTSDGKAFIRARDYILYANETFSTSRMRADITIPISVPW